MFRSLFVVLALGAAIEMARAQLQPHILPPTTPSNGIPDAALSRISPPLSREEAERLRQRLRSSLQQQAAAAPRSSTLRSAGLHPESDAVEQADAAERAGTIGPVAVGLAQAPPAGPRLAVDPALAEVTRLQLRARLNRDPTAAELTAELKVFDARVARANQWLAANRTRIAKAYASSGTLSPTFDNAALDPAPPDRQNNTPAAREAFRALFRATLTQPDPTAPATTGPPLTQDPVPTTPPGIAPRLPVEP